MGIITGIITAFLAILVFLVAMVGNAFSKLLADDAKAWLPKIVESLVLGAVKKVPDDYQERFDEEWRGRLEETPGDLVKLVLALRFQYAAWKMRAEVRGSTDGVGSNLASSRRLAFALMPPTVWNFYTAFKGLSDFFDLPLTQASTRGNSPSELSSPSSSSVLWSRAARSGALRPKRPRSFS